MSDEEDWLERVVKLLDMALILTGAAGREELVGAWFEVLDEVVTALAPRSSSVVETANGEAQEVDEGGRPPKRRRTSPDDMNVPSESFPDTIPASPTLRYPISRVRAISLTAFQTKVANPEMQTPLIIEASIEHWPAFEDGRAWKNPSYLMRKTLHGRRLVPVEIGRSYTDEGWGQKILSFQEFMERYMLERPSPATNEEKEQAQARGYLAQHDLFAQIPSLRADIAIPDYCYTSPAPQPSNPANVKAVDELEEPLLNAWFGPAGTISPLHTDPYHNILSQVVGYKYVRLYAPEETPRLYPRGSEGDGIDMSNTSQVDLDEAMAIWPEISCWGPTGGTNVPNTGSNEEDEKEDVSGRHPQFRQAKYAEAVLGPGECLYIPTGWWHYVRSLTPSFSVSFWWN